MWRKESSEPRHGKYLEPLGFGETQSLWRRVIPGPPGPWESQSQPVIWATGTLARLLAPEGGRAAQRTLRNRRDGVARLGEAAASHTCSGLVPLCPTGQNHARTDTPPGPWPFRPMVADGVHRPPARRELACRPGTAQGFRLERTMTPSVAFTPSWADRRPARPPAIPRRQAALPAGTRGIRAKGRRAASGPPGRRAGGGRRRRGAAPEHRPRSPPRRLPRWSSASPAPPGRRPAACWR